MFRRRLRDYSVRLAGPKAGLGMGQGPGPWSARVDVFRRYDVDNGNITQVLNQCLADGDAESGLRLCTAVRPCWLVRGTFTEGGDWLDGFLRIANVADSLRGPALV